eukprot:922293-Amphidinium_carterae.1
MNGKTQTNYEANRQMLIFTYNAANLSKDHLSGNATVLDLGNKYDDNLPIVSSMYVDATWKEQ